jgi:predicted histidine transporter YuiF (NhaC family)
MTQNKTNQQIPPGLWAVIAFVVGVLIYLFVVYTKNDEPKQYDLDKTTLDELRACARSITVIPIDSCEYIVTPVIGATRGLTLTHKANCKNH